MRTLTNIYHDFDLINIGFNSNGRGPYLIRQDGIPPGSESMEEDRFILRKDGVWMINFKVSTLGGEEQNAFLLNDIAEIRALIESLPSTSVVDAEMPPDMTREEILKAMASTQSRIWQRVREAKASRLAQHL